MFLCGSLLASMAMQLYHVTNFAAAEEIRRTQRFKCGEGGFAGGAIYFSEKEREARKRSRMGSNVVIACWVHLGRVFQAPRKSMNRDLCKSLGYDSVKINGIDVYAVYDASRIEILHFKDHHTGNELSSPPTVAETRIDDTLNDMVDSGQSQSKTQPSVGPIICPSDGSLSYHSAVPISCLFSGPSPAPELPPQLQPRCIRRYRGKFGTAALLPSPSDLETLDSLQP
mmetsp:Transcript_131135/g.261736  ORF Transcript_131135/g.261736 Transcript_131135/m.261736 type:complete len:227 (+) Transcript_131135:270-950(+)